MTTKPLPPIALGLVALTLGCTEPSESPGAPAAPEPVPWGTPEPLTPDAGRVTLHRLNNIEFQNSTQELLATELALGDTLPADPIAGGFDNNAEALTISALYIEAAEAAIDAMIADSLRPPITIETTRHDPEDASWSGNGFLGNMGAWDDDNPSITLYHGAIHSTFISVEHAGPYTVRVRTCHEMFGNSCESQVLPFWLDAVQVAGFDVGNVCRWPEVYEAEVTLAAGEQQIGIGAADQSVCVDDPGSHHVVDWVELEGPLDATGELSPGLQRLYICDPLPEDVPDHDCARQIVHNFMDEAWRRPVTDAEVDSVMKVYALATETGGDVHEALRYAVKRTLMSPWFLFRVEVPSYDGGIQQVPLGGAPREVASEPLSAHELAARLSYFLWSRPPDTELRARADDGTLLEDSVLEEQTRRMLQDPKAEALVDGLGAAWLGLRQFDEASPDTETYPSFDDSLREAMELELRDLIRRSLLGDTSMLELLTAETSWLEPRLAEHYGLELSEAGYATVEGRSGAGVLGTGAFLTATSNPTRTSPVRRGHWVAENLLCEPPPPPPDGVEQEFDESEGAGTVPEQLAAHRANPACAGCHDQLDPIGIALESFDGVGLLRSYYPDGNAIETSGELDGVGKFADVAELAEALSQQQRIHRCMVQKVTTYALGRATRGEDWPFIQPIEAGFVEGGHHFADLVVGIVRSDLFRTHRGGS